MFKKLFLKFLQLLFCHINYRVKYIGLENLDKVDKCLVCPNHSHSMDPLWVYVKVKNMWIMAKAELFSNKFMIKLLKTYNVFPIKRGEKDARSLIHAINIVKNNDHAKLLIFPEGTRIKKDKERGRAKIGPVYIAAKAGVPIVPVYITKNPKLFSSPKVIFGEPIEVSQDIIDDKKKMQDFSNELLDKIYNLKEKGNK